MTEQQPEMTPYEAGLKRYQEQANLWIEHMKTQDPVRLEKDREDAWTTQRPDETRGEWKERTFLARYGSSPAAAKLAGIGTNLHAQMEKLASDLNGDFDRDEVELGLPRRTRPEPFGGGPLQNLPTPEVSMGVTPTVWDASLDRVREGLISHELEQKMLEIFPEPQLTVMSPTRLGSLKDVTAALQKSMTGGDTHGQAVSELRCIKPPLGCGKSLVCPDLGRSLPAFRDTASQREYQITGMCQACQDKFEAEAEDTSGCEYGGHCKPGECAGPCGA
jgi:hypothetical protein